MFELVRTELLPVVIDIDNAPPPMSSKAQLSIDRATSEKSGLSCAKFAYCVKLE